MGTVASKRRAVLIGAVALALAFVTGGVTPRTACGKPLMRNKAGLMFCCCPTPDGGTCCNYVSVCDGFIPGCFCE